MNSSPALVATMGCKIGGTPTTAMTSFDAPVRDDFHRQSSIVSARHTFYTRHQTSSESVDEYITDLRTLAHDCEFGTLVDKFIASQLVSGCFSTEAREQLLQKQNIDLAVFLVVLQAIEKSRSQMSSLQISTDLSSGFCLSRSAIQSHRHTVTHTEGKQQQPKRNIIQDQVPTEPTVDSVACTGCGQVGHWYRTEQCLPFSKFAHSAKTPATCSPIVA